MVKLDPFLVLMWPNFAWMRFTWTISHTLEKPRVSVLSVELLGKRIDLLPLVKEW